MGGEHEGGFQLLADNIFHEEFSVRLATVRKLKHMIIGNKRHKSELVELGVVPRLVGLLGEPGLSPELLCEAITALGSFAHGARASVEAVVSAKAVPYLSRGLLHPSPPVILCCLRTLSTLYSCTLYTLDSDLIFQDSSVVSRLVSLLAEPHPFSQKAALLLAKACQSRVQQSVLCEHRALQQLASNLQSPISKVVTASLLCLSSIVYENAGAAHLLATEECEGEPLVCAVMKILSTSRDKDTKMAAAKCLAFLHRCTGLDSSDRMDTSHSDTTTMDTAQSGKGSTASMSDYGMDNFQSGLALKVLPTLARLTRHEADVILRTEAISTLAYLTELELPLQELAADSEKLVPCVANYLTMSPPDPESELVLSDHKARWQRLRGACLLLLASLASSREELRCKVSGQRGVVEQLTKALQDDSGDVRVAALRCLLSLSRSTKLLRTCLYDHACWKHVVDLLAPDPCTPSPAHAHILCLRSATAVTCNLLLPFSPCREAMIEMGVVSTLAGLVEHEDEVIRVNTIWALMSTADSSPGEVRHLIVSTLTLHRLLGLLSPSSSPALLRKALGLVVNLTQSHDNSSDIGEELLTQVGDSFLATVDELMEGVWPEEQVEQCLCLLVNLSGCGSRAKDILTGQERLVRVLCSILRNNDTVSMVMAAVDVVRNLAAVECDGHVHRQNCLKEFGANTALQKLEIKFEHKRLQLHIQDALEQFAA